MGNKLTNTGALPSACCLRWDQPNGWHRRCWRVVDVFELCLRDGRVNVRFGGKRSSCLRLRLKQLVPRLRRRSLRPTGCETIVPLSRIVGSQGCRFEAWLRLQAVSTLPKSREHERVTVFHLDIVGNLSAQHFAPFIETIDWNQASAFLESLPVRWCGIDGFNPGVYRLVRNLFIPSTMMQ